ncbi:sigma 54-interacting transcriptional regulator [Pyxidicoccus xibeiensis]|uniref:sigma 54-interacting transcriptional regulator n=1 Tax=Pyxidicoccus xibeiensis TaxID=2906759 RepID=UPI0020A7CD47|nr:sigma 54-interacting transcriptional regulator [Pyxidicoccus xibeiensis]MCP3141467.1 sigma 54-interacting transcriptional regulator [Pyxidicoccus xibeiensis]
MSSGSDQRTLTGGAEDVAGTMRVRRLLVVHGEGRGALQVLDGEGPYLVGRAGGGAVEGPLALPDGEVSRAHARVVWDADTRSYALEDAGSRNGTFLDGRRVQGRQPLPPGAVVRVGASLLLYEDVLLPAYAPLEPESQGLPGPSLGLGRVRAELALVAPQPMPVLVLGETGVGKELVAEELHRRSGRTGSFVPLNCAAISPQLAESELFGHTAGAFTGAQRRSDGLFVAADGGTLFLDEVGELPLELQPKLLRALSRGEVRPVGATAPVHADVRVVAATHRDLARMVAEGRFRDDLLARLSGWMVRIPALRERKEDVLALGRRFLARAPQPPTLSADAAEALLLHDWPHNVRELEQVLTAAAVRAGGGPLRREHLPPSLVERLRDRTFPTPAAAAGTTPMPLEVLVPRDRPPSRDELHTVLTRLEGNMAQVADFFGKDRRQVYRWAERLGIDPDTYRKS